MYIDTLMSTRLLSKIPWILRTTILFFFVFFGNFLFSSSSALQEGLVSFRGTLRCENCNAEKDVV